MQLREKNEFNCIIIIYRYFLRFYWNIGYTLESTSSPGRRCTVAGGSSSIRSARCDLNPPTYQLHHHNQITMGDKLPKSVWAALKGQLFASMPIPKDDYTGKTVIVTGSNTGNQDQQQHERYPSRL